MNSMTPAIALLAALAAKRDEYGLNHYLNLFINQQVRSGRYAELYAKWVDGASASLTIPDVYY